MGSACVAPPRQARDGGGDDQTISTMDATRTRPAKARVSTPRPKASVPGRSPRTRPLAAVHAPRPDARDPGHTVVTAARGGRLSGRSTSIQTRGAFTPAAQALAATFATETSTILNAAETDETDDYLSIRFLGALRACEVIAEAQGVLMEREGLAEHDAYSALRRLSLEKGRPLQERAEHIVESTRRPDRPGPDGEHA